MGLGVRARGLRSLGSESQCFKPEESFSKACNHAKPSKVLQRLVRGNLEGGTDTLKFLEALQLRGKKAETLQIQLGLGDTRSNVGEERPFTGSRGRVSCSLLFRRTVGLWVCVCVCAHVYVCVRTNACVCVSVRVYVKPELQKELLFSRRS